MAVTPATRPRHVFGPVMSGRLGRSLGLDLLGARICSFDCLYCEVGPTDVHTVRRAAYVRPDALLAELAAHRQRDPSPVDAVTLGGLGEPCLNTGIQEIIRGAKSIYPGVPVALLTNSSLLWLEGVRRDILEADIVLPSLDSLIESEFARINRPAPEITLKAVTTGLYRLREQFSGRIYLEVLLADRINDSAENLEALLGFRDKLRPDRIDVVTLSRPGAYPEAQPAPRAVERFRQALGAARDGRSAEGHGPPSLLAAHTAPPLAAPAPPSPGTVEEAIVGSLRRRPQTQAQLAQALGLDPGDIEAALNDLSGRGRLTVRSELGEIFYSLAGD